MAETAAHLVDHVFPPLPARQWVLSVPKRLRYILEREPRAVSAVLQIFRRVIEAHLRGTSPGAGAQARLGAGSFVHLLGSSLNRHTHYHCCILDGVFEPREHGQIRFLHASALTAPEIAGIAEQIRRRVSRWSARRVCSIPMTPATCSAGKMAASRMMPRCTQPDLDQTGSSTNYAEMPYVRYADLSHCRLFA
jgi:hypothetical protein